MPQEDELLSAARCRCQTSEILKRGASVANHLFLFLPSALSDLQSLSVFRFSPPAAPPPMPRRENPLQRSAPSDTPPSGRVSSAAPSLACRPHSTLPAGHHRVAP